MTDGVVPASVVRLGQVTFSNLPNEWKLRDRLSGCFNLFSTFVPFSSPLELDRFFRLSHFEGMSSLSTLYGTITTYRISAILQQMMIARNNSLPRLCLLALMKQPPNKWNMDTLLLLPANLFREFIIINFSVYWLPMTHIFFHRDSSCSDVPKDLATVFSFLTDPRVFEKMELQVFVVSWLQHVNFYTFSDGPLVNANNQSVQLLGDHQQRVPLSPPHHISQLLVSSLQQMLCQCETMEKCPPEKVFTVSLLGIKMANFLCQSSEYVCAQQAAKFVHSSIQSLLNLPSYRRVQLQLEYETMCIMLRSMNAFNMYLTAEDQHMFVREAPNLLRSMKQFNMLLKPLGSDSATQAASSPPILPVCLTSTSDDHYLLLPDKPGLSMTTTASEKTVYLGPSGDDWLAEPLPVVQPAGSPAPLSDRTVVPGGAATVASPAQLSTYVPPVSGSTSSDSLSQLIVGDKAGDGGGATSAAFLYLQLADYYFAMCHYRTAYQLTLLAGQQVQACFQHQLLPSVHLVVELLRIMCKICMIKRKYDLGIAAIRHALAYARHYLGRDNLVYANLLIEYGCLMQNTDKTQSAAIIYRVSLAIIVNCLPGASIMAVVALEAIAYAHYVLEYTSGDFSYSLDSAQTGTLMLRRLNHDMCMQAASANRVRALIIEEIAIDDNQQERTKAYLNMARDLHMESLDFCKRWLTLSHLRCFLSSTVANQTFGLWNIQTAKHFGNLGRLYQSIRDTKQAESMHLKAIMIKEHLLGPSDFEVGLSVGHLASLYNYDMERYGEAEKLYLRSIQINLSLFGPTYSGLEYDYRGLQRVYQMLGNHSEAMRYRCLFEKWQMDRQLLRTAEPDSESVDRLEPPACSRLLGEEQALWSTLFHLFSQYLAQFGGLITSAASGVAEASDRGDPSLRPAGGLSQETSRSTGN